MKDTIKITDDDINRMYAVENGTNTINFDQANELIMCLQLIECAAPSVHANVIDELFDLLPKLYLLLKHPLKAVSTSHRDSAWIKQLIKTFSKYILTFPGATHVCPMLSNNGRY